MAGTLVDRVLDGGGDGDELIGDRFHGCAQHLRRPAAQRQSCDHRPGVAAPVGTALAGPERKYGEAVAVRRNGGSFPLQLFSVLETEPGGEPADHVAALAQRATQDISLLVEAIDESTPGHRQLVLVEDDA